MPSYEVGVNVILGSAIGPRIRESRSTPRGRGCPTGSTVKTSTGLMCALLALNKASGMRVYDVVEEEAFDEVVCPLHGSAFRVTDGEVPSPPATNGLTVYPVKVEGNNVLIGPPKP